MPVYKVIINAKNPNIIPGKMQLGLIEPLTVGEQDKPPILDDWCDVFDKFDRRP
jgi:hypothetical protein